MFFKINVFFYILAQAVYVPIGFIWVWVFYFLIRTHSGRIRVGCDSVKYRIVRTSIRQHCSGSEAEGVYGSKPVSSACLIWPEFLQSISQFEFEWWTRKKEFFTIKHRAKHILMADLRIHSLLVLVLLTFLADSSKAGSHRPGIDIRPLKKASRN